MSSYYSLVKVKKSLIYFLIGRSFMTVSAALFSLLLVWHLPVREYGGYIALSGLIGVISLIASGGMGRILPRFLPELKERGDTLALRSLSWRLFLFRMAVVFVVSMPLTFVGELVFQALEVEFDLAILIPLYLNILFSEGCGHLARSLQVLLLQRESAIGISIEWLVKLLILWGWLLWGEPLTIATIFWIQFAGYLVSMFFLAFRLAKRLNRMALEHAVSGSEGIEFQRLWKFGWHNYVQQMLGVLFSPHLNKVFSASMIGSVETAFFGFSYMCRNIIQKILPSSLLMNAIEPAFMARYSRSGDFGELNSMASLLLKLNLFILAPLIAWLLLSGWPMLDFVSNGKYGDATWILGGLMFLLVSEYHRMALQLLCNAVEHNYLLISSNTRAALLIPVQLLLMIWLGMPGLIGGLILISWYRNYFLTTRLRRAGYPYHQPWKDYARMGLFACAAGGVGWLADYYVPGIYGSVLSAIVTSGSFLLISYLWKVFSVTERELINRGIGRRLFVW